MLFRTLDVTPNTVRIDEDVIERPSYMSVGQWTEFWENAKDEHSYDVGYEEGLDESKREREDLKDEKEALEEEVYDLEKQLSRLEDDLAEKDREIASLENRLYEVEMGDDL